MGTLTSMRTSGRRGRRVGHIRPARRGAVRRCGACLTTSGAATRTGPAERQELTPTVSLARGRLARLDTTSSWPPLTCNCLAHSYVPIHGRPHGGARRDPSHASNEETQHGTRRRQRRYLPSIRRASRHTDRNAHNNCGQKSHPGPRVGLLARRRPRLQDPPQACCRRHHERLCQLSRIASGRRESAGHQLMATSRRSRSSVVPAWPGASPTTPGTPKTGESCRRVGWQRLRMPRARSGS
jgi:hypothetical protein